MNTVRVFMALISTVFLLLPPCVSVSAFVNHKSKNGPFIRPKAAIERDNRNIKLGVTSVPTSTSSSVETTDFVHDLQAELNSEELGLCHGVLHASGVRRLTDLQGLTDEQISSMGVSAVDSGNILRVMSYLSGSPPIPGMNVLSTQTDGAFDQATTDRFAAEENADLCLEAIDLENDVYKGRLFTVEQCEQINRMAEYDAYRKTDVVGGGWTNTIYTLTAQHIQCKNIVGMVPTTKHVFRQLFRELYSLFPDRLRRGSILFENDGEPHLVKYNGRVKGTEPHTDNSEHVYITVNVCLSADDEYTGGGTYITKLDRTIRLQQGEMLIHLGDLEHSGAEITSGVRRILIAFLACGWEDETLNEVKTEHARDSEAYR